MEQYNARLRQLTEQMARQQKLNAMEKALVEQSLTP